MNENGQDGGSRDAGLMEQVEARRREQGLSQAEVATICRMSQGHYSKLLAGTVPLGKRSRISLLTWLDGLDHGRSGSSRQALEEASGLVASISGEMARLASLLETSRRLGGGEIG